MIRLVSLPNSKIIVSCIFDFFYKNNTIVCLLGVAEQLPISFHAEMTANNKFQL